MAKLAFSNYNVEPLTLELIERVLLFIEAKYGKQTKKPLAYHNENHALQVIEAAQDLANLAITHKKIGLDDKKLLLIAAAYHDVEQDLGSGKNEQVSADLALKRMEEAGYSRQDREKVKEMIMATKVYFKNDKMYQSANSNYLTKLLADADLASLGKPTQEYWKTAMKVLSELYPTAAIGDDAYNEFIAGQIPFLIHHSFYTQEAEELFPYKQDNIAYVKSLLGK